MLFKQKQDQDRARAEYDDGVGESRHADPIFAERPFRDKWIQGS